MNIIEWKVKAYVYLVKANRMEIEKDVPSEYREEVAKRLIAE
jgi:hypothetical protein